MRERPLPWSARTYIGAAVAGCALAAAPGLLPAAQGLTRTHWPTVALLALAYAACEWLPRCPLLAHRMPKEISAPADPGGSPPRWATPLPLAAALLLPPPAALLAVLPGALLGRTAGGRPHRAARRIWHAAQLGLAVWTAALVHHLLGSADALGRPAPALLLPALAAAAAFSLFLTLSDGGVLVAAEGCSPRAAWRGRLLRGLVPHLVHGLAGLMTALLWVGPYGPPAALCVLMPMVTGCWVVAQYQRERAAHRATVRALVQAVDIKDRYTRGHSERVGRASALIAAELGMDADRTEALRLAGILHDVGKLGVPTRILRKAGPLTDEERRIIQLHPEYGHEMVRGISFLGEARAAILHHHERLDGSGYPHGLRGKEIPETARAVAVADTFDAMTSTRSYRRARPVAEAVAELRRCAGRELDPRMVRALVRALERGGWSPAVTADGPAPDLPAARTAAALDPTGRHR
ncbi:HD-GYP domain-containing protein [Streptomyces sp. 549]|uniref:HD-GYP domain-containing protein n=1 Tax=Streptomyces sp. 549 TaxID=3049076 RepID=UPI0024C3FB97|nr:HD-GYP domain-containing protein [Streptomyces sp. 549]MDK1476688.1 HD-GYP domain-containing protein [Streptomyces sp. 549]